MELTKENYFQTKLIDGIPVVSNSALKYILPSEGGSFARFKMYLESEEPEEDTKSLSLGKKIHKFMENPGEFEIAPENVPGGKIKDIIEEVFAHAKLSSNTINSVNPELTAWEVVIRDAARDMSYQPGWKDATIIKKIEDEGQDYFSFLCRADGKVAVTFQEREKIERITENLRASHLTGTLLSKDAVHEYPILFEMEKCPCKALIDNLIILDESKTVVITDLKTTSSPASQFMGYNVWGPDEYGHPIHKPISGAFHLYGIYRQMAFYAIAVRERLHQLHQQNITYPFTVNILVVETEPPYEVREFTVEDEWLSAGYEEIVEGIKLVNRYIEDNKLRQF